MRKHPPRSAYAMVAVLVALVLFLALWGIAHRQIAATLRVESAQALRTQRDEGSLHALAQALTLLETGTPPTSPYVGTATVPTSRGSLTFTVTFTVTATNAWSVHVAPAADGVTGPALPTSFNP